MDLIDKNMFTHIARGSVTIAEAIRSLLHSGAKVYIPRAAYNELVLHSPTPQLRDGYKAILHDLGIKITPEIANKNRGMALGKRMDVYFANPGHGEVGHLTEYSGKANPAGQKVTPGDMFIAAEAKSLGARLHTADQKLANRAKALGVDTRYYQGMSGPENIAEARRLLGLREFSRPSIKMRIANIKTRLEGIKLGGPGGLGIKIIRGVGIFAIATIIGGWLQARADKKAIEEGMTKLLSYITDKIGTFRDEIAKYQLRLDKGEKVYVNYIIEIHFGQPKPDYLAPTGGRYDYPYTDSPSVFLGRKNGLGISSEKQEDSQRTEKFFQGKIEYFARSVEVGVFTEDELDTYRELIGSYSAYKRKLMMEPKNLTWNEEAQELRQILALFGPDAIIE